MNTYVNYSFFDGFFQKMSVKPILRTHF